MQKGKQYGENPVKQDWGGGGKKQGGPETWESRRLLNDGKVEKKGNRTGTGGKGNTGEGLFIFEDHDEKKKERGKKGEIGKRICKEGGQSKETE